MLVDAKVKVVRVVSVNDSHVPVGTIAFGRAGHWRSMYWL